MNSFVYFEHIETIYLFNLINKHLLLVTTSYLLVLIYEVFIIDLSKRTIPSNIWVCNRSTIGAEFKLGPYKKVSTWTDPQPDD